MQYSFLSLLLLEDNIFLLGVVLMQLLLIVILLYRNYVLRKKIVSLENPVLKKNVLIVRR